jgi:DNA-binding transcriptional LysR family regulator
VPTIGDLEIFARVVRAGNMSAAGREMGLTPAVVSKRISQLEQRLGARLFQRTTRQLTLTETGAGYFRRVVDILSLYEEAEDFISRGNTSPRGVLKVSVPTTFSRLHVAPHLHTFLARYPEIRLDLHVGDAQVDIVREGFDLAIRTGELPDSSLVARRIAPDNRAICATRSYLQKHGEPRTLAELESHSCLTVDTAEVWRLHTPGGEVHFRPSGSVRCNSNDFVRELVVAGAGVGMLSTWDVGPALRDGSLRVILPEHRGDPDRAVHAVYPTREFMPAKVAALIDFLAQLYGPTPYWEKDIEQPPRLAEPITRATSSAVVQRALAERPLERRQV